MKMPIIVAGVSLALLAALQAAEPPATAKQVAHALKKTTVDVDQYSGEYTITTEGPDVRGDGNFYSLYLLSTFTKKDPTPHHSVFVKYSGADWLLLDHAVDSDAQALKTEVTNRGPAQGFCCENLSVDVDGGYLEAHSQTGMNFRLYGKNGNLTVEVPNFLIQGLLKKEGDVLRLLTIKVK